MSDPGLVNEGQTLRDLGEELAGLVRTQGLARDPVLEGATRSQLGHEEEPPRFDARSVDPEERGVNDPAQRLPLSLAARQLLEVQGGERQLHGPPGSRLTVEPLEHGSGRASPEEPDELVVGDAVSGLGRAHQRSVAAPLDSKAVTLSGHVPTSIPMGVTHGVRKPCVLRRGSWHRACNRGRHERAQSLGYRS